MGSFRGGVALAFIGAVMTLGWGSPAVAEPPTVRVACSNQVCKSYSEEQTKAFSKESGIQVAVTRGSSSASISEVFNDRMDVASSARELYAEEKARGLREFPFCVSPIAVITKAGCGITAIPKERVAALFTGAIGNWRDLDGPDLPVAIVVPSEETAAYRNFRVLVTGMRTIRYDFLARDSTGVIELVRSLPCGAVSFIGYGALTGDAGIGALDVSGLGPTEKGYPYAEVFRLVTKGEPTGPAQAFVDFAFSQTSRSIIEAHGMVPLAREVEGSK